MALIISSPVTSINGNTGAITGVYLAGGTDVALADGGTNATLTAALGGVVYSTSSALAISAVGTAGQYLQSNGAGAPTWGGITKNLVVIGRSSNTTITTTNSSITIIGRSGNTNVGLSL